MIPNSPQSNQEKGLVSIIIPTYNRAALILESIHSAKAQSYPLKQIIVVDDGSTDNTLELLSHVEGIEVVAKEHSGQGATRDYGLRFCRGQYIASLDSDDVWDKNFLTDSVGCLEKFELDFVFTNWNARPREKFFIDKWLRRNRRQRRPIERHGDWCLLTPIQARDLYVSGCPSPSSSLVMRRDSMVAGWSSCAKIADDWHIILDMVLSRPCRVGFSKTPRWSKRTDGQNVCDGRLFEEVVRELFLHDTPLFRRTFRQRLTAEENARLWAKEWAYRSYLGYRKVRYHRVWSRSKTSATTP